MLVQFRDHVSRYFKSSRHAHLDRQRYDMACREPTSDVAENLAVRSVYGVYRPGE